MAEIYAMDANTVEMVLLWNSWKRNDEIIVANIYMEYWQTLSIRMHDNISCSYSHYRIIYSQYKLYRFNVVFLLRMLLTTDCF